MGGPTCTLAAATATAYPLRDSDNINDQDGIAMTTYPTAYPTTSTNAMASTLPPTVMGTELAPAANYSYGDGGVPMHLQPKLGATCCGCCCDFRRATIITNSVIIGLSAFSLFSLFNRPDTSELVQEYDDVPIDDDQVIQDLANIADDSFLAGAIIGGVLVVFTAVPLYGAYVFNVRMIGFGVVLLISTLITEIVLAYVYIEQADDVVADVPEYEFNQPVVIYTLTALVTCLYMYPHIGLIMEIRAGIMSFDTYPREAYSMCCGVGNTGPRSEQPAQQHQQQAQPDGVYPTNYYPTVPASAISMNGQSTANNSTYPTATASTSPVM